MGTSVPPSSTAGPASVVPFPTPGSSWPTFRHDVGRTSFNPLENTLAVGNISSLALRWTYPVAGAIEGSPTVVDGVVYFGAWDGYEYALNTSNGTMIWKTFLGVTQGTCTYAPTVGVTSSAALVNGTLFVGGGDSYWYALNASSGVVRGKVWVGQTGASGGYYNWASPLIVGNFAYIGMASECDNPGVRGGLLMVNISDPSNLTNSSVVHRFSTVPSGQTGASIWGTPSYDPSTHAVYVATGNPGTYTGSYSQAVVALNASTLKVLSSWQILNTPNGDSDFSAGPMQFNSTAGVHLVVAANKDGFDYALNASNLTAGPVWSQQVANPRCGFPPTIFDGATAYLSGGCVTVNGTTYLGSIRAVTPGNQTRWVRYLPGFVLGGASAVNGLVVGVALAEHVGVQQWFINSTVEFLDAANGSVIHSIFLPDRAVNSTPTVADGQLFLGAANQTLTKGGELLAYSLPLTLNASALARDPRDPSTVSFTATVSGGSPAYLFHWSFGDGRTSNTPAPLHTYATVGNHTANLTVIDAQEESRRWSVLVAVPSVPTPSLQMSVSPTAGAAPLLVNASVSVSSGTPPFQYAWSFGDGGRVNGSAFATHRYDQRGEFSVLVSVSDSKGRASSAGASVDVVDPLSTTVLANVSAGFAPLTISLSDRITGGKAPFTQSWEFGDGSSPAQGSTVEHTFASPGNFSVGLWVNDSLGLRAMSSIRVFALVPPFRTTIDYQVLGGTCPPPRQEVRFNATATGGWAPYRFTWAFGDNSPDASGSAPEHNFTRAPPAEVSVVAKDALGDRVNSSAVVTWAPPRCGSTQSTTSSLFGPIAPSFLLAAGGGAAVLAAGLGVWMYRRRSRLKPAKPPADPRARRGR